MFEIFKFRELYAIICGLFIHDFYYFDYLFD